MYTYIYVQITFSIDESQKHSQLKKPGTKDYIPYDPTCITSRKDQTNSDIKQVCAFLGLCVEVGVSGGVAEVSVVMKMPSVMWLNRGHSGENFLTA